MSLINDARALLAVLSPLTGTRSTGTVTVNASPGPTATLPRNAYAVPVMGGVIRYDRLLKIAKNSATTSGDWTVGTATPVAMTSNLGGADVNVPAGTPLRWWPAVPGIEAVSVVANGGIVGGTAPAAGVGFAQAGLFEELTQGHVGDDIFKSVISRWPALLLAWEGSSDPRLMGRNQWNQKQIWGLYAIISRQDADPARRVEGLMLFDAACDQLWGQQTADGFHFSSPKGAEIPTRRVFIGKDARFFVYKAVVETWSDSKYADVRQYLAWAKTRLDMQTPDPTPLPLIVNNVIPMP